jgi:hypothetical protein
LYDGGVSILRTAAQPWPQVNEGTARKNSREQAMEADGSEKALCLQPIHAMGVIVCMFAAGVKLWLT